MFHRAAISETVTGAQFYHIKVGLQFIKIAILPWQGLKGSNPRPTVLETAALPAELNPYILVGLQGLEPGTDRL